MIDPETAYADITDEISTVLVGNEDVIEAFTISVLTGGHVLVEGVPGVAKTTAADLFANVLGLEHRRLQMTPDMLPADITGTHVYHQSTESSELARGPIFSNAVVVDEITRATPKAQSALLEAMEEETVTIEGETLSLPDPFIVIATKNSVETDGTFDLPKSQRIGSNSLSRWNRLTGTRNANSSIGHSSSNRPLLTRSRRYLAPKRYVISESRYATFTSQTRSKSISSILWRLFVKANTCVSARHRERALRSCAPDRPGRYSRADVRHSRRHQIAAQADTHPSRRTYLESPRQRPTR